MSKPRLIPLKQWFCDTCNNVIDKPEEGYVEWLHDKDGNVFEFRIVHHASHSPLKDQRGREGCYQHGGKPRSDLAIDMMVGPPGIIRMLKWIDMGRIHDPDCEHAKVRIKDLSNWTDTFRRLHLPYYEEARLNFEVAVADGFDANEVGAYYPDALKGIIEDYGDD